MNYSAQEIENRLKLGEDSHWEFKQIEFKGNKPDSSSRDNLADEIAAFANASGGVLVCGVTDAGKPQGMSRTQMDPLEKMIAELCHDSIKPSISINTFRCEVSNSKPILIVTVPESHTVHESPGGNFCRSGSSKRKMSNDQTLHLTQTRARARSQEFDEAPIPNTSISRATITVRCNKQAVADAKLLVLFPNKTWKKATTNENGEAEVDLHSTHLSMTVFVAGKEYAAQVKKGWIPAQGALALTMCKLPDGGSVIFPEGTGFIPGLEGRLNPIRDTHDRTYLYASNIAVNRGRKQPVAFEFGEDLHLTDANGQTLLVSVKDIVGRSSLIEYSQCFV